MSWSNGSYLCFRAYKLVRNDLPEKKRYSVLKKLVDMFKEDGADFRYEDEWPKYPEAKKLFKERCSDKDYEED